jgi:hypothetical protein
MSYFVSFTKFGYRIENKNQIINVINNMKECREQIEKNSDVECLHLYDFQKDQEILV